MVTEQQKYTENPWDIFYRSKSVMDKESRNFSGYGIDIEHYVHRFDVVHPEAVNALHQIPALCFSLGRYDSEGILRDGAGLFNIQNPDQAMLMKGLFNHAAGSARIIERVATLVSGLTDEQRKVFVAKGFYDASLRSVNPTLLRDVPLYSHGGDIAAKQDKSPLHFTKDRAFHTSFYLYQENAPTIMRMLLQSEHMHTDPLLIGDKLRVAHMVIVQYADHRFGQSPVLLSERFKGLRDSNRQKPEILEMLEKREGDFEAALVDIYGSGIVDEIGNTPVPIWETNIRRAYAASAGLKVEDVFPTT